MAPTTAPTSCQGDDYCNTAHEFDWCPQFINLSPSSCTITLCPCCGEQKHNCDISCGFCTAPGPTPTPTSTPPNYRPPSDCVCLQTSYQAWNAELGQDLQGPCIKDNSDFPAWCDTASDEWSYCEDVHQWYNDHGSDLHASHPGKRFVDDTACVGGGVTIQPAAMAVVVTVPEHVKAAMYADSVPEPEPEP